MAEQKNKLARQLKDLLSSLGLGGEFLQLIDSAVRNDWGAQEFIDRLINTKTFRQRFPGLITNGQISPYLLQQAGAGINASTLGSAIQRYEQHLYAYGQVAEKYGFNFRRDMMRAAIKFDISPDELGARLNAVDTLKRNPDFFKNFERLSGQKFKGRQEQLAFLAGAGGQRVYDLYEATLLKQADIGLSRKQVKNLAGDIGTPGALDPMAIGQLVDQVRQNLQTVGPELAAQGINSAQLVKALANPSLFPKEIDKMRQIMASRQALSRPVQGSYGSKGSGGGLSLFEEQGQAAYG